MRRFEIHEDIAKASTLPSWIYSDPEVFREMRERVFVPSWQLVSDTDRMATAGQIVPMTLLEECLDEPVLLTRDPRGEIFCLSNVCTHRGNLVAESETVAQGLRCRYHGRRFGLDGRFQSMPEFEGTKDFPTETDSLPRLALGTWGKFLFAALRPEVPFEGMMEAMTARCGWMPIDACVLEPSRSREYLVSANWALYCDNYLEGFHIPYVHEALSTVLDYGSYRTETFPHGSLQIGIADDADDTFDLPLSSPDRGERVAAYYFWLFPNTMFNFYPWGISINIVRPLAIDRTRVSFLSYVWDRERLDRGAGSGLHQVEMEDERVVESVQRGVRSRLYERGRYSPTREQGVHHFHRLLAERLGS